MTKTALIFPAFSFKICGFRSFGALASRQSDMITSDYTKVGKGRLSSNDERF